MTFFSFLDRTSCDNNTVDTPGYSLPRLRRSERQMQPAISSGIENIACERDRGCALAVKPPATICDPYRIKARFRPTVAKRRFSS